MAEKPYIPPYTISDQAVNLVSGISEIVTRIDIRETMTQNPKLRRDNRIRMIHASLAIENNALTLNQVTDIINGKRILGPPNEICEVKNAFEAYDQLLQMNPYSVKAILRAHKMLMYELTKEAGIFRSGGVGIFAGEQLVHMAPPADHVPQLVQQLVKWMQQSEAHPLIKSCVFHYEFEFIHPFTDGNGRMGRMWQTLLLNQWNPIFGWLPIETLIRERQEAYYRVLGECDRLSDSGKFVDFLLQAIYDTLLDIMKTEQATEQATEQVERLMSCIGNETLTAKEMMNLVELKHRPTFRDNYLLPAIKAGLIEMTIPDKPNSSKQKYRRK